ncbi:S41 family peptidase [Dyadobacter sp. LHD-138]|uniref:S41 family peptidase n=1 Tax=Dyadobacter sp. LHD-138 TaxID=3071413 RepID=UPI0027DFEB5A|nr:S41 family peptidase [Dyadobacter sp. LHD-138]MDQ6477956.1 S41 family peptidase [Dyadobacter sp. LHD-138]
MKSIIVLTGILLCADFSYGQEALTGSKAYDYLQAQRELARAPQRGAKQPPLDSLKKAEKILQDALVYYHRPEVMELAKKNDPLFYRKSDISFDLAVVELKLGKTDSAARLLEYPLKGKFGNAYAGALRDDALFTEVKKDPVIASLLTKIEVAGRTFESGALKTPYKPDISEDEKIAGLSKLWSEAKYNFAYFDHIPQVDWDKLYLEYIPKIRSTKSTVEYLNVLKLFCAKLQDGHTDVWGSDPGLTDLTAHRPPIRTVLIENRVFVQEVSQDSLEKTGIKPMLEIISVDGIAVKEYADQYVRPYQSGSTVQNVDVNTYTYRLLNGPKTKPVAIMFRDTKGKNFTRILPRSGYSNVRARSSFGFRILPGNIAYVELRDFESNKSLNGFKAAFDSIATTNALIIDVRMNGGGDSGYGWDVLGHLTDKPMETGYQTSRIYSPLRRARGGQVEFEQVGGGNGGWAANGKKLYTKPVVVLTSGRTFSAAEDFSVVFDAMKRGTLVGEPTGGSTGQPLMFSLPGGVMARVCTKRDMYPDGTEWNAKGIQPHVFVKPTISDFQAGKDTVLDAALVLLKK